MVTTSFTLGTFEFYLLILVRVASFFVLAPFYGMNSVPNRVRAGLAGVTALLIMYAVEPTKVVYSSEIGYSVLVLKEIVTGLIMAYSANICSAIILFAGNMIDMDIGLSMASQFDQSMNAQVTVTGSLYNYFFMLMFVVTYMYQYVFRALVDSFSLIPLGGANFDFDKLQTIFVKFMVDVFVLGFRIMLPVFATIMIINCILGVMAKVAPQMNMFSVGIQIKVMVGFGVLFVMIFLFPQVCDLIYKEMGKMLRAVIRAMST